MKRIFVGSLIGLLFILPAAQAAGLQRLDRYGRSSYSEYDDMELTREQTERVTALERDYDREIRPMLEELDALYREMDGLETTGTPDRDRIDRIWNRINGLERGIAGREAAYMNDYLKILTPEQRRLFDSGYGDPYPGRGLAGGVGRGVQAPGFNPRVGAESFLPGRGLAQGYGRGAGRGRGYIGRGVYGRGLGAYPWSRGVTRDGRYSVYPAAGRGPCGAGRGRYDRRSSGRGWRRRR